MDSNQVSPQLQTCVLKIQLKCESCQNKVKKMLKKIHGVHSIRLDANEGTVAVSSTVDPQLFIAMLAKAGERAELLWDPMQTQTPMSNQNPQVEKQFRNSQNSHSPLRAPSQLPPASAGGSTQAIELDHAQLQELAKIKGLKHIELRHSRNIKLTFKDMNHAHNDHAMKIILDGHREPELHNEAEPGYYCNASHCHSPATRSVNGHVTKNVPRKCCHGASGFGNRFMEEPISPMPAHGPPVPMPNFVHPFATPPSYYAHHHSGLQCKNASYGDVNCSDDGDCAVM